MKAFDWHGLTLLPQRAVWRAETRTLFVADVHIGKAAAFRAAGLAAPAGTTRENLARLDALIDALAPRALVALGDLFHAREAWRAATLDE
ncbi:MAG: DEAD/DEAH box helicase, partial [Pseudomonadota bacterium]|nr:DEAD/DEAH box helicase [Pseudomonadota bacterium]